MFNATRRKCKAVCVAGVIFMTVFFILHISMKSRWYIPLNEQNQLLVQGHLNDRNGVQESKGGLPEDPHYQESKDLQYQPTSSLSDKFIVVTTIHSPTRDIEKLAAIDGWTLLVVGDVKTPTNWSFPGVIYLSLENQKRQGYKISDHLPSHSYTRKNIAYLWAIQHGARYIYDTDDDNHPTNGQLFNFQQDDTTSGLIYDDLSRDVMNPYAYFGQPSMWPRGYPLEHINEPNAYQYTLCHFRTPVVQQGLVDGDPDVDAIYRLTRRDSKGAINVTFDSRAPPVTLPTGVFAPYNSQNTFFAYDALWSLYLPTSVSFRVTDIWRGYWAQRLLWLLGHHIAFYPSNAIQVRNAHSYMEDFLDEDTVYRDTQRLLQFLKVWTCKESSFYKCVQALSHEMAAEGFWQINDAKLIDLWLEDLVSIGYHEPEMVLPERPLSQPARTMCLDVEDSRTVFFNPVLQKQVPRDSALTVVNPTLTNWETFCGPSWNLSWSPPRKEGRSESTKSEYDFSNLLLIVAYNSPFYENIKLLDMLFFDHFRNILYCGEVDHRDTLQASISQGPFQWRAREVSFLNVSAKAGYFLYECAFRAVEMGYRVDGYLLLGDDVLLNLWNLKDLLTDVPQFESLTHMFRKLDTRTVWQWWNTEYGQIPTQAAMAELQALRHNSASPQTAQIIEQFFANRMAKGIDDNTVSQAMSDLYYVPNKCSHMLTVILRVFYKHQVFTEIAVPTTIMGLYANSSSTGFLGRNVIFPSRTNDTWQGFEGQTHQYMHPIKLSKIIKNQKARNAYCTRYISRMIPTWL